MGTKISELNTHTPDGTEYLECIITPYTPGTNRRITSQQIADLGGGGAWGTITGTLADQTDLYAYLRGTRTVTGADSIVQGDDNSLIIFNSATPFNFTLDQLTASTKASFLNIGAGAVTLVAGSGVTITGEVIIPAAVGTDYPSAFVFYHTLTTPRVVNGTSNRLDLHTSDTSGATITLDFELKMERMFIGSASFATAKTIELDNDDNALVLNFVCTITNVAGTVDFPTTFTMQTTDSRWTDASHRFTPATTGKHEFSATWDGTDWNLKVTNAYA